MKKGKNSLYKIISFIMVIILSISLTQGIQVKAASNTKRLLVLIEEKDGTFKEYDNLTILSPNQNVMLKAYSTAKALGLSYKRISTKEFKLTNGSTSLTFAKYSTAYTYNKGTTKRTYRSAYKTYTKRIDGKYVNVIHFGSLSKLLNVKYFSAKNTSYEKDYSGIIVLSKFNKIPTEVPEKPEVTEYTDKTWDIGSGIKMPVIDKFPTDKLSNGCWAGESTTNYSVADKMIEVAKVVKEKWVDVQCKIFTFEEDVRVTTGDPFEDFVVLAKDKKNNCYKLTIDLGLSQPKESFYPESVYEGNRIAVKALCSLVSSKPETLYNAIYQDWVEDVIFDDNWKPVGDSQVKYIDGTYYIKAK